MSIATDVAMTRELAMSSIDPAGYPEACARVRYLQTLVLATEADNKAARSRHREDIEMIGTRLIEEAEDRGWCEVYDEVISDLNDKLYMKLEERTRDFVVEVQALVTFKITVPDQTSKSDAEELATDWIENDASSHIDDVYEITVRSAEVE